MARKPASGRSATETDQLALFEVEPEPPPAVPYQPELISPDEESGLVAHFRTLPFKAFDFHGHLANRRTISFGVHYDFGRETLVPAPDMPDFLLPIREKAARFAGIPASDLRHALITEHQPGAGIGWHRDKPAFQDVIGLSLVSPCVIRLQRRAGASWKRLALSAEPRSAYLLRGPLRTDWEHSIRPLSSLRYSVTFRSLRQG